MNSFYSDRKVKLWTTKPDTSSFVVDFKIDSSAQINVLIQTISNKLHRHPKLKRISIILNIYNNTSIPVLGKCKASVTQKNTTSPIIGHRFSGHSDC